MIAFLLCSRAGKIIPFCTYFSFFALYFHSAENTHMCQKRKHFQRASFKDSLKIRLVAKYTFLQYVNDRKGAQ